MAQAAKLNSKRLAVIHGNRRLSFAEAWERGSRLANALLALGLEPGDRVGVLEDNSIEAQDFFAATAIATTVTTTTITANDDNHTTFLHGKLSTTTSWPASL